MRYTRVVESALKKENPMATIAKVNGRVRIDPRLVSLIYTPETKHFATAAYDLLSRHNAEAQCVEVKVSSFPFGEPHVEIMGSVRNTTCFLFFDSVYPNVCEGFVRLMVTLNALHHASPEKVHLICPFFPFSRQDRKSEYRGPISVQLMPDAVETHPAIRSFFTIEAHSEQSLAIFRRVVPHHLKARTLLVEHIEKRFANHENIVIEAPDIGAAKRAEKTAFSVGPMVPYGIFDKRRTRKAGATVSSYHGPDLADMDVVFIDDMIDTGGTLIVTAQEAFRRGARSVTAYMAHALLSSKDGARAEDKLRSAGVHIVATNSIYRSEEYHRQNADVLTTVPLEPLLADAVFQSCQMGGSLKAHSE